jgi:hypothetical protein
LGVYLASRRSLEKLLNKTIQEIEKLNSEYEQLKEIAINSPKTATAIAEILKAQSSLLQSKIRAIREIKSIEKIDIDIKRVKENKKENKEPVQIKIKFEEF